MSDENTGQEQQDAKPEVEERARTMGWVPEGEWEGEPPKGGFRTAEDFVERGETDPSIARESKRNLELDHRLQETSKTLGEVKQTLADFKDHHTRVEQRAYDRAMADLKAKQRQAVSDGDVEAFDEVAKEAEALAKEAAPAEVKTNGKDTTADVEGDAKVKAEFDAWHKDNDWYDDDIEATQYAESILPVMGRKHPTARGREFYDKIADEVRKRFPEKFGNPRRRQAAAVAGAGDTTHGRGGGKTYSDLPAEAKAACDRLVADGEITKKEYLQYYEWD